VPWPRDGELLPDCPAEPVCPALAPLPAWLWPALPPVVPLDSPDGPPELLLDVLPELPLLPPADGWDGWDGNGDSLPPLDELVLELLLVLPPWVCGNGEGCDGEGCDGEEEPGDGIEGGCGIDGD
jgi:hypothetical protein